MIDINNVQIRLYKEGDSIPVITSMLNQAYKQLLDMGLRYLAASQDDTETIKRLSKAYKAYIATYKGQIIGTVSLYKYKPNDISKWYNQSFVSKVGQFAVLPKYQSSGIGSLMMDKVESDAKDLEGIEELALDTAETAHHLISYYSNRDYVYKETIKWPRANYNSVIMSKVLK